MDGSELDSVLEIQLAVAWAGEGETDPPRLGWWRTTMGDRYGGEDLLQRLTPKTHEWAVLETVRAAAIRVDERAREGADDADHLVTLFRFGFETDERLGDRLRELKLNEVPLSDAFPVLGKFRAAWSRHSFEEWLATFGEVPFRSTATGRRLTGEPPRDPEAMARRLAGALLPRSDSYPMPHFRVK
jgi:hypothetical protein